jgi:hypothetical protein
LATDVKRAYSSSNIVFSIKRQMLRLKQKQFCFYNWSFYKCSNLNKLTKRPNRLFLEIDKLIDEALTGIWKSLGNPKFPWALKTKMSTIVERSVFASTVQYSSILFLVLSHRLMWSLWAIGDVISITDW